MNPKESTIRCLSDASDQTLSKGMPVDFNVYVAGRRIGVHYYTSLCHQPLFEHATSPPIKAERHIQDRGKYKVESDRFPTPECNVPSPRSRQYRHLCTLVAWYPSNNRLPLLTFGPIIVHFVHHQALQALQALVKLSTKPVRNHG